MTTDDGLDEAAVEHMIRDETADLRRDLDDVVREVGGLEDETDDLRRDLDEARRRIGGLDDAIDGLNARLSKLEPPR